MRTSWSDGNVLYPGLGGSYSDVYIYKNSLNYNVCPRGSTLLHVNNSSTDVCREKENTLKVLPWKFPDKFL